MSTWKWYIGGFDNLKELLDFKVFLVVTFIISALFTSVIDVAFNIEWLMTFPIIILILPTILYTVIKVIVPKSYVWFKRFMDEDHTANESKGLLGYLVKTEWYHVADELSSDCRIKRKQNNLSTTSCWSKSFIYIFTISLLLAFGIVVFIDSLVDLNHPLLLLSIIVLFVPSIVNTANNMFRHMFKPKNNKSEGLAEKITSALESSSEYTTNSTSTEADIADKLNAIRLTIKQWELILKELLEEHTESYTTALKDRAFEKVTGMHPTNDTLNLPLCVYAKEVDDKNLVPCNTHCDLCPIVTYDIFQRDSGLGSNYELCFRSTYSPLHLMGGDKHYISLDEDILNVRTFIEHLRTLEINLEKDFKNGEEK